MTTRTVPTTLFSQLKSKIEAREARVAVIGLGYVGLPLTLLYTEQKFPVTGFDIDERKVTALNKGESYIYRIPAPEIQQARKQGFTATSDYARITEMDAIIICVPTPLNEYHEPDLSFITDTASAIAPHLRAGQLVVLESTTYPGTTEEVMVPILEKGNKSGLKAARTGRSRDRTSTSPSRPSAKIPGTPTVARRDIPKVVGGLDPGFRTRSRALWRNLQPRGAGVVARCGGDDQVARKHLPLREHRAGQRTEDALHAHGNRYLGSDRGGLDQAVRIPSVLSRARSRRTLHSRRSVLSFLESERVRLPHPLYRAGGRDQHQHAVPRDCSPWRAR